MLPIGYRNIRITGQNSEWIIRSAVATVADDPSKITADNGYVRFVGTHEQMVKLAEKGFTVEFRGRYHNGWVTVKNPNT